MIQLERPPARLSVDSVAWLQTIELALAFAWKPSPTFSRILARPLKFGVEVEVGSSDAEGLAQALRKAFKPKRMGHQQLVSWGAIGLYAMDRIGEFVGAEQRDIISFCEGGRFLLRRRGYD